MLLKFPNQHYARTPIGRGVGQTAQKISGEPDIFRQAVRRIPGEIRRTVFARYYRLLRIDGRADDEDIEPIAGIEPAVEHILVVDAGRIAGDQIAARAGQYPVADVLGEIKLHSVVVLAGTQALGFVRAGEINLAGEVK